MIALSVAARDGIPARTEPDPPTPSARARDPRLDFFRGLAMIIIFISHIPANPWAVLVPGRYGFSDAAEMFVFCSGFAAAIAFGGTFVRAGFWLGTARILQRCWQLYWAHIALFIVMFTISALAVAHGARPDFDYVAALRFDFLVAQTHLAVPAALTLTYIPNLVDILPMYIVVLAMMPVVMALHRVHPALALAAVLLSYGLAWLGLGLPAQPNLERTWFFNPFAWALLFYTAFAISMGWIRAPGPSRALTLIAIAYVVFAFCASWDPIHQQIGWLHEIRLWMNRAVMKGNLSLPRFLHFLALAYLAVRLLDGRTDQLLRPWARPILLIGRQALPTFLASIVLAWGGGAILDAVGRTAAPLTVINLGGILLLMMIATVAAWYKSAPWQRSSALVAAAAVSSSR